LDLNHPAQKALVLPLIFNWLEKNERAKAKEGNLEAFFNLSILLIINNNDNTKRRKKNKNEMNK
jgi:hypothetical protein